jgi:hypothetical protein
MPHQFVSAHFQCASQGFGQAVWRRLLDSKLAQNLLDLFDCGLTVLLAAGILCQAPPLVNLF